MTGSAPTAKRRCEVSRKPCEARTAGGAPCRNIALSGQCRCAPHLGRAGRKSKLNPWTTALIVEATRLCCDFKQACAIAGVAEATGYNWRHRGRVDLIDGIQSPYSEFLTSYRRAWADAEFQLILALRRAMSHDWRAAAGFLQLRDPEHWNVRYIVRRLEANPPWKQQRRDVVTLNLEKLSPADRARFEELMRKARPEKHAKTLARRNATAAAGKQCRNVTKSGKAFCAVHLGDARKLTHQDAKAMPGIVSAVRLGVSYTAACLLEGIQKEKARLWWEAGETSKTACEVSSPYERFWWDVRQAEAEAQLHAVYWLRKVGEDNFWATMWHLERFSPEHWCKAYQERRTSQELRWLEWH